MNPEDLLSKDPSNIHRLPMHDVIHDIEAIFGGVSLIPGWLDVVANKIDPYLHCPGELMVLELNLWHGIGHNPILLVLVLEP